MIRITTLVGKGVQRAARLRGGGSALPGLVVEKLDRHFLARTLDALPHGVVVVSGTNGKTSHYQDGCSSTGEPRPPRLY